MGDDTQTRDATQDTRFGWIRDRFPITVEPDAVAIGSTRVTYDDCRPDTVLYAYIALVNQVRLRRLTDIEQVRNVDLDVLAHAFNTSPTAVRTRLAHLIALTARLPSREDGILVPA
jgi:hypothetical protein